MIPWKIIFINFLLSASILYAVGDPSNLDFGRQLLNEKDYNSAVIVFKQIAFFSTDAAEKDQAKLGLAQALYGQHKFDEAANILLPLIDRQSTPIAQKAHAEYIRQCFEQKQYLKASSELREYGENYQEPKAMLLSSWAMTKQYDFTTARQITNRLIKTTKGDPEQKVKTLDNYLQQASSLPQKDIGLAQWLSYFLPGMGQLYAENWADGVVSFTINALTISLLINALEQRQTGLALIWVGLESAWYFGNVYAAGNSANKYNQNKKEEFVNNIQQNMGLDEAIKTLL